MANIDEALVTLIGSISGITDVIGTLPTMRLWPLRLKTDSAGTTIYPAITYQRIDGIDQYAHGGFSNLVNARYQLTLWTTKYLTGKTLELAVKSGLRGYKGTVSGVRIDRIFIVDGPSNFEPITQIHQRNMDLIIGYAE